MSQLILLFFYFCSLLFGTHLSAALKHYPFANEPIDVVIPSTDKDLLTLDLCIQGIKSNCSQVRRVIVVSSRPMTDLAEWFDEAAFPFNKDDVELHLLKGKRKAIRKYNGDRSRVGWYFQQLLKFYAPLVIPNISSNVLILDSDTIFLNPVEFLDANNGGLYNPSNENHPPYFAHAARFLPGLRKLYPEYSGIAHHTLFQLPVLQDLFSSVENYHKMPFWKAFCLCVDPKEFLKSGAAEPEIYFNFAFERTDQVHIRFLKWANINSIDNLQSYKDQGYHYISCHAWSRG